MYPIIPEPKPPVVFFPMAHMTPRAKLMGAGRGNDDKIFPRLVLSIVAVYIFGLAMVINYMAAVGHNNLFPGSSIRETTEQFMTLITPAYWTFHTWVVIHVFMGAWTAYILLLFVRSEGDSGEKMYLSAPATRPHFLGLFVFNLVLNAVWFIAIANKHLTLAAVAAVVLALTVRLQLLDSYYTVHHDEIDMIRNGKHRDLWAYRYLFHNGLEAYSAWMSIVSVLNVAMCIQYCNGESPLQAALTPLFALGACMVIWFPVENFSSTVEPIMRYGFLHYAVLAFGFLGILLGPAPSGLPIPAAVIMTNTTALEVPGPADGVPFNIKDFYHDLSIVHGVVGGLLALSLTLLMARMFFIFCRHRNDPLYIRM